MDSRLSDAVFASPAAPTLGGPGPLVPVPAQPKPRTARVRVTSEVVGVRGALGGYYRSMPPYIDDLTREFGPELYDRMQLDDQVSSSLRALCHGVLSDELVLRPGVDDKGDPDFAAAKNALGFCERATWGQTGGLDQWLLTMLKGAVGGGNRVSETVLRPEESGRDAGKWVPDRLKVKPRRSIAFAVDSCNNLAGFLGLPPGGASWGGLAWGTTFDPQNPPDNFLPRDKFCALAWDPLDEDPRGSAILRCVYEPWWAKLQAAREWLAYLAQFGSPSLAATTAPGADSSAPTDAWGNPVAGDVLTPEQDLANQLVTFRNGGVIVLPAGCTLDVIQSSNAGDGFLKKVDACDRAIAQGILLAMRAVMQSRFGSRADAEQGQDVAGLQTRFMKRWVARMVTEDLLRPLVRINYGPDAARRLCPYASLSPVEHQDLGPALVAMTGAWKAGFLKPSQLPWAHEQFGMPPATPEELQPPPPQPAGGQPAPPGGPGEPPPAAGPPPAPPAPPPGPPDLGFSDPDAGPRPTPPGPPQPPAGFPSPWRRVRPDGWEEVYDPGSGQWVAGDQLDPEDIDDGAENPAAPFAVWDESQHTRGQPENAGQFGPGGYGAKQPASAGVATAEPADPAERRRQKAGERRAAGRARREAETAARLAQPPAVSPRGAALMAPALARLFPEGFAAEDAHALVGAPKGAVVGGYANEYTGGLNLTLEHPHVDQCSRSLSRNKAGDLVMSNQMFFLKKANRGSGLGLEVFSGEVRTLAALGVDRIQTCAGKGGIMNGYYTWARLGYDAPLEDRFKKRLPEDFKGAETVQDLMATAEGRGYWKAKGYMGGMTFDLKAGSRSLRVLNDYLASKGKPPVEVDAAKVDALKARREEARKALPEKARAEARATQRAVETFEDRQAMNTARNYWRGQAAQAGISGDVLDTLAGRKEDAMIAERKADPDRVWGVSLAFPGEIRFAAYREAGADLIAARHAERMADPSLADVRGHYEREAESRGLDPGRVRAVAAETAYASPDAVYAVGRAYATAIDALAREGRGTAPFSWEEQPRVPAGTPEGGEWGPAGTGGLAPVPAAKLARYLRTALAYVAANGPAPASELAGHLTDAHRLGPAKARAVVGYLAADGSLARTTDEYGRAVLGKPGKPAPRPAAPPRDAPALPPAAAPTPAATARGRAEEEAVLGDVRSAAAGSPDGARLDDFRRLAEEKYGPEAAGTVDAALARLQAAGRVRVGGGRVAPAEAPLSGRAPPPGTDPRAHALALAEGLFARPEYARTGLVPIHALRDAAGLPRRALDDALMALDRADVVRLVAIGDRSRMTPEQLAGGIEGENETFAYVEKGPRWDGRQAAFSRDGPDLSGLGDLLNLSRQEVLDALFDAAVDSFDLALPDAAFGSPDQPRLPAGRPGGGEWTSGGGGGLTERQQLEARVAPLFARLRTAANGGFAPVKGDNAFVAGHEGLFVVVGEARGGAAYRVRHVRLTHEQRARVRKVPDAYAQEVSAGDVIHPADASRARLLFRADQAIARGQVSLARQTLDGLNEPDAPFYSPDQPRVPAGQPGGGRWAGGVSPGIAAARDAASDAVRDFARGQGSPTQAEAQALAGHLAKLTLAQIHALKAQHGLKGSAPNKAALVAKLAERFRAARASEYGLPEAPRPGKVYNAAPSELYVDPSRFQYKLGTDPSGVTAELKSVRAWNPDFAGVVSVWKDPADGKTYVVNGHHRHELATRLGSPALAVRYVNARTATEARAVGALVNIAEGRGTAVDAAKFMRDSGVGIGDMERHGVSVRGKVAEDAVALARLSDRAFGKLTLGTLDQSKALAVAKHLPDHALQDQLFGLLDKREDEGKDLSLRTIEEMAREMAATPTHTKREASLFGDIESEESLFVPRNELKGHVRAELSREVNDFLAVASERRAGRVAGAGNVLDVEKNRQIAEQAARVRNVFDTLVNRKGEISDAINDAAGKLAAARTRRDRDAARSEAVNSVRDAVLREAGLGRPGTPEPAGAGKGAAGGGGGGAPERGTGAAQAPADAGRGNAGAAGVRPPEPLFTGIDSHGHQWVNGVQVAREEEPAAPLPETAVSATTLTQPVDRGRIEVPTASSPAVREASNFRGQPAVPSTPHPAKVAAALGRYANRDVTAKGGGLFGGEDLQARQGFSRLPDGTPVVFAAGEFAGRTGKIVRDTSGGTDRIVAEVDGRPGLVPVDYTTIEPLNAALSWRTEAAAAPLEQKSLLSAEHFLPRREVPPPPAPPPAPAAPAQAAVSRGTLATPAEAAAFAGALREAVTSVARKGSVASWCDDVAMAVKHLFPSAENWQGEYLGPNGPEPHTVAKVGPYWVDVTADQFGGKDVQAITSLDPAVYRGFARAPWPGSGKLDPAEDPRAARLVARLERNFPESVSTGVDKGASRRDNTPVGQTTPTGAKAMTSSVADHPALAGLAKLAKKDAYGKTLTVPVTVAFEMAEHGPDAGKWFGGMPQVGSSAAPDRSRAVGDVTEQREGNRYYVRIAVPHALLGAADVRRAVHDALPALRAVAVERFRAANRGAEVAADDE